ncbi:MAG: hypothetical protein HY865_05160 [Chloroflexi bacterium]|nr:hypothetical protein [Chloroflexota bacterium]
MKLAKWFAGRLPSRRNILGVYAVIVFLVYSWTLATSFYKLPSWLFYLNIGQVLSIYAYAFSADVLDSVLALAGVLVLDLTLFLALRNAEEFQSRSIIVVLVALISSAVRIIFFPDYEDISGFLSGELTWWSISLPLGFLAAVGISKIRWARKILDGIAERAVVFLYIYLPLSLVSLLVVLIRNLY